MDKNTQQPVAWVVYNGWRKELPFLTEEAASDFVAAEQLHSDLSGSLAAYRVIPTYTAPPVPRDVLMAALNEVNTKYMEVCGAQFGDEYIAALADRYASKVAQAGPVNRQLLAETVAAYWIDNGVAGQIKEAA